MTKKLLTPVLATSIPIDWVKVKSSTIQAVSYNKEAKAMHVMFLGGGVYELTPVRPDRHNAFMQAGKYYGEHFRYNKKITARRIDDGIKSAPKSRPGKDPVVVATPLYLALVKTKKRIDDGSIASMPYLLWSCCGRENTVTGYSGKSRTDTRYARCLELVREASGVNRVGSEYLDGAIALAAERKL